eukprot:CAMPEP_0183308534 /NCGR_PEP_ID=MMETSP0160_2-20130417/22316_1 /TAXON_ID=2839 ORGANISM="Odontella Sinensis, Strain Grunow 1884" /NCGR_SAMPLE_ID=MMETSP0160_2 /ASSEMBLY_ACC=CAM_ASM_000250 /LENGTH=80 /DNA_ID=CAMNT_0025472391 /DNA_START=39 /DNA_END=277 /DNA_ORIENTATION=+
MPLSRVTQGLCLSLLMKPGRHNYVLKEMSEKKANSTVMRGQTTGNIENGGRSLFDEFTGSRPLTQQSLFPAALVLIPPPL